MSATIVPMPKKDKFAFTLYDIFKKQGESRDEFYASFFGNASLRQAYGKKSAEVIKLFEEKSEGEARSQGPWHQRAFSEFHHNG